MDVSVESAEGLHRKIKVVIPSERVEQVVEDKVRRAGQHAKIPGFRPGKAPMKVLLQRYGERARQEATAEIVQTSFSEALKEVELKPAGQPELELGCVAAGQGLEFSANFDVYPDIEIKGLEDIVVTRPVAEITAGDIDRSIERLREQSKEFKSVERESCDGDQAIIDYEGRIDGEVFEGGTGHDIEMILGDGRFLPDLERGLVGRKFNEEFDIDATFPDDYNAADLAGKTAQFHIRVKAVAEPKLPAITDADFLKKIGAEDGGEAELREKVSQSLRREADASADARIKQQVMDGLLEANPTDVPETMVGQEIERLRAEAAARLPREMQKDSEQLKQLMPDESLRESARRRAALGLLLAEVIRVKDIELDSTRVDAKLDDLTVQYEEAEQIKQYYRGNRQLMQGVEAMAMEGQVVEALLQHAQVKEQKLTLDDLMKTRES